MFQFVSLENDLRYCYGIENKAMKNNSENNGIIQEMGRLIITILLLLMHVRVHMS